MREKGVATGEDVERGEDLAMHALDPEEARERRGRLAKMRSLLFKHELKAKRVKAIKSKTFHRHNRKTGARVRLLGEDGNPEEEDDGEGGGDGAEARREYLRAQERMLLKHKNTSRWAKRAIRKGLAHLPGTKEAIAEQLRIGNELRRKIAGKGAAGDGGDGDGDYATFGGYGSDETDASEDDFEPGPGDGNDDAQKNGPLARAKRAALRALEGGDRDADPETTKGLFALPFMARAMKKKREAAEKEAKALLEEIEKAERGAAKPTRADEDERDERGALAASEPRGGEWGAGAAAFPGADVPAGGQTLDGQTRTPPQQTRRSFGGGVAAAPKKALDDASDEDFEPNRTERPNPSANDGVVKRRGGNRAEKREAAHTRLGACLLYTSPSPRDRQKSRMPSSA